MPILILSIACSVAVSVLLKIARKRDIHVGQAIAINYAIASALAFVLLHAQPASLAAGNTPWGVLVALGILLPSVFLAMAGAVRHAGIVLSDAAQRLSLFLPLLAAFLIFGETASSTKLAGIALGIAALFCLLWRSGERQGETTTARTVGLLLCVWVGYGVIDILFKQLAKSGAAFSSSLFVTFVMAGILMLAWLTAQRTSWHRRNIVAGICLGLLNFGNIYFYIRAHQAFPDNPTLVFSAMNIGVISAGTLVGAGFFRERLSWLNGLGVVLAICAIVALIPR